MISQHLDFVSAVILALYLEADVLLCEARDWSRKADDSNNCMALRSTSFLTLINLIKD